MHSMALRRSVSGALAVMSDGTPEERLFLFAELALEQGLDIVQGLLSIGALCIDLDSHTHAGGQHHDTHDAFGIDALGAARDKDFTAESARQLSQLGSGTGM